MSWHFKFRGTTRGMAFHALKSRGFTCGVALHSIPSRVNLITRQIFKSHMLTLACDTCKLTRMCEVIVELYCTSMHIMHIYSALHIIYVQCAYLITYIFII